MTDSTPTPNEAPAAEAIEAPASTPEQPAVPSVDDRFAAMKQELETSFNERVKGFQQLISAKDEEIKQLKTASMSEEEREQLLVEETSAYYEGIEAENWILRKAQENAAAAELFDRILNAEPDEQFRILSEALSRSATTTPTPEEPDESEQVPDIDLHNPAGTSAAVPQGTPTLPDGTPLTPEFRKNFLQNLQFWPTGR